MMESQQIDKTSDPWLRNENEVFFFIKLHENA